MESLGIQTPETSRLTANGTRIFASAAVTQTLNSVTDQFVEQVLLRPNAAAVICGGQQLTYSELSARAERIAAWLRRASVEPGQVVGICAERTVDLPAAVLGVLTVGAAYLPIDAALPKDRVRFMLQDSGAVLLLTGQAFAPGFQDLPLPAVTVEAILAAESAVPRELSSERGDLAYVIYTSGSTGTPKGVEVLHPGLTNFIDRMREELRFNPGDRMLAHSSFSFDISVFELFLPLTTGGTVVLVPRSVAAQSDALRRVVESSGISVMLGTPTTWQLLIGSGWEGDPRLTAICGGEILPVSVGRWLSARTKALWNHYGPSETTIAATTYKVIGDEEKYPIGSMLPGLQAFVLDVSGNAVLIGAVGELYIGGIGVARGYRNRPELTEQRFTVINSTADVPALRAYKTGDLVRSLPDGNLEFVGRVDNQVKVRGFRIELEEIEVALCQHPGIASCVVLAVDRDTVDRTLVAFYELKAGKPLAGPELRKFLSERLPAYMLPGTYLAVNEFAITPNGKVDRVPLRSQAIEYLRSGSAPLIDDVRSLEESLRHMWRRALGHPDVGIDQSFFELGGTSLMAAALVADVQRKFGMRLPVSIFFEAPTVAQMAQLISDSGWVPSWSPLVPINSGGSRPPLFCIHPIGGNVLSFQPLAARLGPDQPVYGLQARGLNGDDVPHISIGDMASDYLSFIRKLVPNGPYLLAGYSAGGVVVLEMARQLIDAGTPPALTVLFDSYMSPEWRARSDEPSRAQPARGEKLRHLFKRDPRERLASLWRNRNYRRRMALTKLRIKTHRILEQMGFRVGPLRSVDDAFVMAVQRYKARPIECDAVLLRADKSDGDRDPDPTMGWGGLVKGNFRVRIVGGDHISMLQEPFVEEIAADIEYAVSEIVMSSHATV